MEPVTVLATTAALFVAEKFSEGYLQKAGEIVFEKTVILVQKLRDKFKGDEDAEEVLQRLERKPESQARRTELVEVLENKLATDTDLVQNLQHLVDEISQTKTGQQIIASNGSIAIGGNVTNSPIITGNGNIIGNADQRQVNTGGGAFIDGDVSTSGGDFVGRDKKAIE
jgi:hypothetical protein